jgi:hypothetical protein
MAAFSESLIINKAQRQHLKAILIQYALIEVYGVNMAYARCK